MGVAGTGRGTEGHADGTTLRLSVAGEVQALCAALETLDAFLAGHDVDAGAAFTVRLAVEEVVTNVIKYAYTDPGGHLIDVSILVAPERVVVRVCDDGREFDPRVAPVPDLDAPLERKAVGGMGIHLIRTMAESLEYQRVGGQNELTVTIRREPTAPGDAPRP